MKLIFNPLQEMRKVFFKIFVLILLTNFLSCAKDSEVMPPPDTGKSGSTSQFSIIGSYMYVVDDKSLKIFDLSNPESPVFLKEEYMGMGIETIFGHKNKLFIGSKWGMSIYDITVPFNPKYVSAYSHVYSCDPVVANDSLAFVTLRSLSDCHSGSIVNQLDVIDIKTSYPKLIKTYPMYSPIGLGIDSNYIFVCDEGIKVYDFTNPKNLILKKHLKEFQTYDVIPNNKLLIVTGPDGLFQYDYSNIDSLVLLSSIPIHFGK